MSNQPCMICGTPWNRHEGMNHKFSENGELEVEPLVKPTQPKQGIDFSLRLLLIQKGIITGDEITATEEAIRDARQHLPQ